jgi:exodeoxyribonuclease V alpha subunit
MQMSILDDFKNAGVLNGLEYQLALSIQRIYGETSANILLAIALTNASVRFGHMGLELDQVSKIFSQEAIKQYFDNQEDLKIHVNLDLFPKLSFPEFSLLRSDLASSPAIWSTDQPFELKPIVLDGNFLFTYQSWKGEDLVAKSILALSQKRTAKLPNPALFAQRLFAQNHQGGWFEEGCLGRAHLAGYYATHRGFCVIQGGPGTGKTTITQRILSILIEQYHSHQTPLRIALAAPTGKAAARMTESLQKEPTFFQLPSLLLDELKQLKAVTIHRLLGIKSSSSKPKYHAGNPLPFDVIVIDEASMIDSWLMSLLLDAIDIHHSSERQHLIFLGDPEQLPAVGNGSPLEEICGDRGSQITNQSFETLRSDWQAYDPQVQALDLKSLLDLNIIHKDLFDSVVALNRVHRVKDDSCIHKLATMIKNDADLQSIKAFLDSLPSLDQQERSLDVEWIDGHSIPNALMTRLEAHYVEFVNLAKNEPKKALKHYNLFGILAPHYSGSTGIYAINQLIETSLKKKKLGGWNQKYTGRPILVTQNDDETELVNGDIGVIGGDGQVYFPNLEDALSLSRLPEHKTVFAMSVHKSQGSEFDEVIFILPTEISGIITKELIYTAITRAKKKIYLIGSWHILSQGLSIRVEKSSSLSDRLS